jgi:hypothetical protein
MIILDLIGKKIVAIKGNIKEEDRRKKPENRRIEIGYILFDDGETYVELREQDYYSFHDCSLSARDIEVYKDKLSYDYYMTLPDATEKYL